MGIPQVHIVPSHRGRDYEVSILILLGLINDSSHLSGYVLLYVYFYVLFSILNNTFKYF